MTTEKATALVATAARELDRACPGWEGKIDVGTLDLSDSNYCVIGQLVRETGRAEAVGHWPEWIHDVDLDFGGKVLKAILSSNEENYPVLQNAWIAAIADRVFFQEPVEIYLV